MYVRMYVCMYIRSLWVTCLSPCDAVLGYAPSPSSLLLFPEDHPTTTCAHKHVLRSEERPRPGGNTGEVRGCSQQPNAELCGAAKNSPRTGSSQPSSLGSGGLPLIGGHGW